MYKFVLFVVPVALFAASGSDKSTAAQQQKKRQQCEKARNEYYHMKEAPRLYKRDTAGERVYYSDEDADALREQARRTMIAACGS